MNEPRSRTGASPTRADLGDFQTPEALAIEVVQYLAGTGKSWARVLEPTCGLGRFLVSAEQLGTGIERAGIEIQPEYVQACRSVLPSIQVIEANLFSFDLSRDLNWSAQGPLLVLGNPPWVTRSELGVLESDNHPSISSSHLGKGLDAKTGTANYDLAEAVLIKILTELGRDEPTVAVLCKPSVARRIFTYACENGIHLDSACFRHINAYKWFGIGVQAGLLHLEVDRSGTCGELQFFESLTSAIPRASIHYESEPRTHKGLRWRQGIKHDAAAVMELTREGDQLINGLGEPVDIEPEYRFPLLKGRDLGREKLPTPTRELVVTQIYTGDDTRLLEIQAPRLWAYLQSHLGRLQARKSSIYRGRPDFCLFGVGPYSFSPYKAAISGLHKGAVVHAVGPFEGRPVVFDDTCYLLPCPTAASAALSAFLINSPLGRNHLLPMVYRDAKRPVTQRVLRSLDLATLWSECDRSTIIQAAEPTALELDPTTSPDWDLAAEFLCQGGSRTPNVSLA